MSFGYVIVIVVVLLQKQVKVTHSLLFFVLSDDWEQQKCTSNMFHDNLYLWKHKNQNKRF